MPNYYLSNYKRQNAEVLNLEKILGKNSKKLELIDEFTFSFKNENEMKTYLIKNGVLSINQVETPLVIVYKNNGKYKKIPVFYNEHRKIKDSFDKIKMKIENRENKFNKYTTEEIRYKNLNKEFSEFRNLILNINFMKELVKHYTNESIKYNNQGINISDINIYLSDVRQNDGIPFLSNYVYIALYELFKNAIFKFDKNTEKLKNNYRGYRDLINFIYKYKVDAGLIVEDKLDDQITFDEISKVSSINFEETNVTEKEFEMYEDGFPPNSEELKKYKAYLESLTETSKKK